MRILGIDIDKNTSKDIRKVLESGWFGLNGLVNPPTEEDFIDGTNYLSALDDYGIYRISDNLPYKVTVSCIVGKNGAGKSSFLQILYMIINNLAYDTLNWEKKYTKSDLKKVRDLYATLYFEINGVIGKVECSDNIVTFRYGKSKIGINRYKVNSSTKRHGVLDEFFYTICVNYSLYALDDKDYDGKPNWIYYLYHKNDGYTTPITFTPFRRNSVIDAKNERNLAKQRLYALTIFFEGQGRKFLLDYKAQTYEFKFNTKYEINTDFKGWVEMHISQTPSPNAGNRIKEPLSRLYDKLQDLWAMHLNLAGLSVKQNGTPENMAISYLAEKTLKICHVYRYFNSFTEKVYDIIESYGDYTSEEVYKTLGGLIKSLVDSQSHITLKIRQCVAFVSQRDNLSSLETGKVKDLLTGKSLKTVDDAYLLLPPPFYDVSIVYRKPKSREEDTITLDGMSSGELQRLYSFSYLLYHIKNLVSVERGSHYWPYKHINIIIDEAELYYHPEFQQNFIKSLIEDLATIRINKNKIRSIHIMLVTHSPFILSDMLSRNTMYLKDGHREISEEETFGANYYDLLRNGFFLDKNAIGSIASTQLDKMISGKAKNIPIEIVGDEIIRNYLKAQNDVQDNG